MKRNGLTIDTTNYVRYYGKAPKGAGRYAFARHWDEMDFSKVFFTDASSWSEAMIKAAEHFESGKVCLML